MNYADYDAPFDAKDKRIEELESKIDHSVARFGTATEKENRISKLERDVRYLEGRVRQLESTLEKIRMMAIAGQGQ